MFDWSPWIPCLFILPWRDRGSYAPKGYEDRQKGEDGKEDPCEKPTTNLPGEVGRNDADQGNQDDIGKALATGRVGREGPILD